MPFVPNVGRNYVMKFDIDLNLASCKKYQSYICLISMKMKTLHSFIVKRLPLCDLLKI